MIELLVTILLSSIVMGAIYSVYRVQTHSMKVQENRMEAQQYARSVLDLMVREIRNAGYDPLGCTEGAGIAPTSMRTSPTVLIQQVAQPASPTSLLIQEGILPWRSGDN